MFIGLLSACTIHFGESLVSNSKRPIKNVSLNNKPWQARPTLANINYNETLLYPNTVSVNKFGGRRHIIDDPYAQFWVPNKVKDVILMAGFKLIISVSSKCLKCSLI